MKHTASCHCGAVVFEVDLDKAIHELRRCNCSLCRKKGALMFSVKLDQLTVKQGEEKLSLYQWNSKVAKHYFCSVCGIYTHHQRKKAPDEYAFNVACLDDQSILEGLDIITLDGATI